MQEIKQPTPIKPIWPTRRDETPKRRKQHDAEEDEAKRGQLQDHEDQDNRGKSDGHRIDEYA